MKSCLSLKQIMKWERFTMFLSFYSSKCYKRTYIKLSVGLILIKNELNRLKSDIKLDIGSDLDFVMYM